MFAVVVLFGALCASCCGNGEAQSTSKCDSVTCDSVQVAVDSVAVDSVAVDSVK